MLHHGHVMRFCVSYGSFLKKQASKKQQNYGSCMHLWKKSKNQKSKILVHPGACWIYSILIMQKLNMLKKKIIKLNAKESTMKIKQKSRTIKQY